MAMFLNREIEQFTFIKDIIDNNCKSKKKIFAMNVVYSKLICLYKGMNYFSKI